MTPGVDRSPGLTAIEYIGQLNGYISYSNYKEYLPRDKTWSPERQHQEAEDLKNLTGSSSYPVISPFRWDINHDFRIHAAERRVVGFCNWRYQPKQTVNNEKLLAVGETVRRFEDLTLIDVGAGETTYAPYSAFRRNIVLVDPIYSQGEQGFSKAQGYTQIARPFSPEVLDLYKDRALVVVLNDTTHHLEHPDQAIEAIFSHPSVIAVTAKDYRLPSWDSRLRFILGEFESIFPKPQERDELCNIGISDFLTLHTRPIQETLSSAAQKHKFKIHDLVKYANFDPELDDSRGLEPEEVSILEQGTRFSAVYVKEAA